jgi:hypothetical protein
MTEALSSPDDILDYLLLLKEDLDSSDSDEEEEMEYLYLHLAFPGGSAVRRFDVERCSELEFEQLFRLKKADFETLAAALGLPDFYHCTQKSKSPGKEALLVLLRRLAYPNRWCDLVQVFGRRETELSLIFNEILQDIYRRFHHLLENLEDLVWLDVSTFSTAVKNAGAPLDNCY